MRLLVGLGNPGRAYAGNRHNIGFLALDAIHRALGASPWKARFQGDFAEAAGPSGKVYLLKPATFMNESGRAVGEAMRFFRLEPGQIAVFHDELDLPPGKLRAKIGGGIAGHNGLRSISAHCGNEYARVRMGIGHPGDKARVHGYVLSDFAKAEAPWVEDLCAAASDALPALLANDLPEFQNRVHLAMAARGHETAPEPKKPSGQGGGAR